MRTLFTALCVLAAGCAAQAGAPDRAPAFQVTQAPAAEPQAYPRAIDLPAGVYRLDPRHASVTFRIRHMELAWFTARFDTIEAELTLDPNDPAQSRLHASVAADSVNTGVLSANGERTFDRTIARALGGAETPRIAFTTTSIERTGRNTARIVGALTMSGQTHPASFDAVFNGAIVDPLRGGATVLGFSAYGVIDRTQWGVEQWRAFTGEDVQIVIEAEFVHA